MHQHGLKRVQREHGDFGVFAVRAGEVAVLAGEDDRVAGVPLIENAAIQLRDLIDQNR